MVISNYQIVNVVKNYVKNMKARAKSAGRDPTTKNAPESNAPISEESIKRMLFDRIGGQMTDKLKRHE